MIDLYFTQADDLIERIGLAVRENVAADLKQFAHKLCGASATCGMQALVPILKRLEKMGTENQWTGSDSAFRDARRQLERIRAFLKNAATASGEKIPGE